METLKSQRDELAMAMANTDPDAFPGSKAYSAASKAIKALAAFDAEHPEVIAEIHGTR